MVRTDHALVCIDQALVCRVHGVICRIILDIQMNSSDIFQVFIKKEGSINSVHIHLPHSAEGRYSSIWATETGVFMKIEAASENFSADSVVRKRQLPPFVSLRSISG